MKQKWTLDELIDSWRLLPAEEVVVNRHKMDTKNLIYPLPSSIYPTSEPPR